MTGPSQPQARAQARQPSAAIDQVVAVVAREADAILDPADAAPMVQLVIDVLREHAFTVEPPAAPPPPAPGAATF